VLRFGASPTSKVLTQWLGSFDVPQILVDPGGQSKGRSGAGWRDPEGVASERVAADPGAVVRGLAASLDDTGAGDAWLGAWRAAGAAARGAMTETIRCLDEPFEGRVPLDLAEVLPAGATLVAGNSMPVRDIDSFFPSTGRPLRLVGTRGASGIDGVASTAVGAAAVAEGPVALLIGDLSFLHDLNGLWPLARYDLSLTVLLVNNDGGGIFHFLPQRQLMPDRFEQWFGTPHGLDLRHAVALHGGRHAELPLDGREAIREAVARPGLDVLELRTVRDRNVELHQQVWSAATEAARAALDR
jgi:2-succinyl-5-enolpyruvyl-6-hydroxy-3-cyclohexene-1-carboxylate synthase